MIPIQLTCLAIVLISLSMGLRQAESRTEYLRRYGLLVLAAWVAEDSCIRCYGFYHYAPGWSLFVDQVPLAIVLIWPCVILSARELAGVPLIGAAIVLTDAGLIEPIAVQAGLWHWTEPGLFGVGQHSNGLLGAEPARHPFVSADPNADDELVADSASYFGDDIEKKSTPIVEVAPIGVLSEVGAGRKETVAKITVGEVQLDTVGPAPVGPVSPISRSYPRQH